MTEGATEKTTAKEQSDYHSALANGLTIGRYKILSVLGEGGFGITYRCHDSQLHRDVAIKEYLPSSLAVRQGGTEVLPRSTEVSRDFVWGRSRFLDEARTMAKLSDVPAVVRVHDFLEAHGTAYVVMHLLEGETLAQRLLRETRLSQAFIEQILPSLLDGLERIHEVGFLHRDIKPANIMLSLDGSPTLIDFGASRAAVAGRSQRMTAIFTPGFAAPEQSSAGKQGPWTDIYGLAATLYACVAGKSPPSALERLLDGDSTVSVETAGLDYSSNFLSAIDVGMLLQANARPQTVAVWRQVLATGIWQVAEVTHRPDPAKTLAISPKSDVTPEVSSAVRYELSERRTLGKKVGTRRSKIIGISALAVSVAAVSAYAVLQQPEKAGSPVPGAEQAAALAQRDRDQAAEAQRTADEAAVLAQLQREQAATREAEEERAREEAAAKELRDKQWRENIEREARANAGPDEAALRLTNRDRQRLQVALTSRGFDVGGIDGTFGPRSREMIAAWQGKRGDLPTGFVTAPQRTTLLNESAIAIAQWEEAQKRLMSDDQRRAPQQLQQQPQRRSGWRWPWE